jgi:hypothetical protein
MEKERRTGMEPVPNNAEKHLNDTQVLALHQIENFGWHLKFLRRPLFQEAVAVVVNAEGTQTGILDEDGKIDMDSDIKMRQ